MKEFNLEQAKAGKPVCTRDGRKVTILKWDMKNDYPIVGYIHNKDDSEIVMWWTEKGEYDYQRESSIDLMMASEKHEGWINLIGGEEFRLRGSEIFETEQEAKEAQYDVYDKIATIHIEWEE